MEAKLYTLVTGGSQGIGEAMAIECAKRGHNLLLVALPGPELENTAGMIIEKYGIDVKTFPVDLTDFTGPESVYKWCESNNYKVNFLINNAGIAGTAIFEKSSIEYSDQRILLNIRALVLLTRYFIPMFRAHGDNCYILNIGSLSAYFAIPFKAIYSASKTFVLQFSKALQSELGNENISVSVVCPNGVETNEGTFARIKAHGKMGKLTQINASSLAKFTIDQVYKGNTVIIPKFINRLLLLIKRLLPYSIEKKILYSEFNKEVKVS